jgi:hypothetical protein
MPQPAWTFTSGRGVVKWGNQPLPNGQGTMSYLDLNDGKQWFMQPLAWDHSNRQLTIGQLVYLARSTYLADDFGPWRFKLPFQYYQGTDLGGAGSELGLYKAQLLLSGEQMFTTDNATGILCKVSSVKPKLVTNFTPLVYDVEVEWTAKAGWWQDLSATTIAAQALNSGSATTWNVTYAGSVFSDILTWTLTIPVGNTAPIASFVLSNTMPSPAETLTINFPGNLAGSTAWTITIDVGNMTITDQNGHQYDPAGSFPRLYGPAGQVNAMSATLTPASGTATSCTIGGSVTPRWML